MTYGELTLGASHGQLELAPASPAWRQAPTERDAEYCRYRDQGLRELAAGRVEER
jgi:hypothetical protein